MKEKKGAIVLGIGTFLVGAFLLFRKKKPALPELPEKGVVVGLLNPPSGATFWDIALTDADVVFIMDHQNKDMRLAIDEAAVFITPDRFIPEYDFPMRVARLSISKWKDGVVGGTIQHLYYVQSIHPYLWDFDEEAWGDEEDPTYKEVFIPDYGSYYYNVAKERFEKA